MDVVERAQLVKSNLRVGKHARHLSQALRRPVFPVKTNARVRAGNDYRKIRRKTAGNFFLLRRQLFARR